MLLRSFGEKSALKIERKDKEFAKRFESKNKEKFSQEKIVEVYTKEKLQDHEPVPFEGNPNIIILSANNHVDFDFENWFGMQDVAVTRYFKFGEKGTEKRCLVLEKSQ